MINCGDPMIIGLMSTFDSAPWAVVEYSILGPPLTTIFICATRLTDVTTLAEARKNTEWLNLVKPETALVIAIKGLGDRLTCAREASALIRRASPIPQCNIRGYQIREHPLLCSNGITYANQTEAARLLGINQGNISRHLRGEITHVANYTFKYK